MLVLRPNCQCSPPNLTITSSYFLNPEGRHWLRCITCGVAWDEVKIVPQRREAGDDD